MSFPIVCRFQQEALKSPCPKKNCNAQPCLAHHLCAVEKGMENKQVTVLLLWNTGLTGLAVKAFLGGALKLKVWVVFLQNPETISVHTDCSIIPENYINHGPKIDLLFPFFFSPAFISYFLSFAFRCLGRFRLILELKCYTEGLY